MAKRKQFINGKAYDWSSVTIKLSGCSGIEPVSIDYGDKEEKDPIYGKGGNIRGYGTGNKSNSVKLTLQREDYNTFQDAVKSSKEFGKVVIPKITVSYADTGATTVTDVISKVTFSERAFKAAQGDKGMTVELTGFAIGGIAPDGKMSM